MVAGVDCGNFVAEALLDPAFAHQVLDGPGDINEPAAVGHFKPEVFGQALHGLVPVALRLPRKDTADDFFDGDFLDVDVADRQFIEERFADGDDPVAFDLEADAPGGLLEDFSILAKALGGAVGGAVALNGDEA